MTQLPFNANEVFDMISFIFEPQANAKGIGLTLQFKPNLTIPGEESLLQTPMSNQNSSGIPKLLGDEKRLKQVMMNLVKNALKFTQKGSIDIEVCYRPEPQNLLIIHVKDTGQGIAQEDYDQLFTRFGKLKRTAAQNSDGIGMGLTLIKQIVETNGGTIDVLSKGVGKGSLFRVTMKMAQFKETSTSSVAFNRSSMLLEP